MQLIIGKTAGFCGGVSNSVTKTEKMLKKYKKIYCLGELVHNKQVVDSLINDGLEIINDLDNISDCRVIVRAHGIPKQYYEMAKKNNIELVDLTCPRVLLIHKLAERLCKEGYFIILIAQKDHPEAIGTISFCGNYSIIVEDENDMQLLDKIDNNKKVAIISQTTYSLTKFNDLCDRIKLILKRDILINNTICNATSLRQKEILEISSKVDAMIIVGGKNSSNTKKLFEIANNIVKTYLVETYEELFMYKNELIKLSFIGIMAGASTSKSAIDDVIEWLNRLT